MKIKNINDSPVPNIALENFIRRQKRELDTETKPSIDDRYSIYNGVTKAIEISEWFSDPDVVVDPTEVLSYEIELDTGEGELIKLNEVRKEESQTEWLAWDDESKILRLNPGNKQVGMHYLRITAKDRQGLSSTVMVSILVRHLNTKPYVNWESEFFRVAEQTSTGIKNFNIEVGKYLYAELKEETEFELNLPVDIFKDADEGIDQEETININLVEVRDEKGLVVDSSFISLDNKDMKLRGNTKGEALDTVDGEKSWVVSLKAEDRAGLSEYLDVN